MKTKPFLRQVLALSLAVLPLMAMQGQPVLAQSTVQIEPGDAGELNGRTFVFYRIFSAEHAQDGESVRYDFDPSTKSAVQSVIARRIGKSASSIDEVQAAEYMRSICEGQQGSMQSDRSEYRFFVEEMRSALKTAGKKYRTVTVSATDASGALQVSGLDDGYYIIDEERTGSSLPGAASLCLALTSGSSPIVVQLKGDYPRLTKQILEDDGDAGWNDIGDFCIGQTIPYRYQSEVPQISGYRSYSFAFHDRMDPALIFDTDSVEITITDPASKKQYRLTDQDYRIETPRGETFALVIRDLKQIVDEQFYQGSSDSVHPYGQQILVRYSARLGEQAGAQTGRPGFENAARLEFSNDPDADGSGRTGFTPWDPVVCFTFRVDGVKVNEKQKKLAGARFALYTDEACQSELKVKKTDSGYTVLHPDWSAIEPSVENEAGDLISEKDGSFTITGLDQGVYYLKEVQAPAGYRKLNGKIRLEIKPAYTDARHQYQSGQSQGDTTLQQLEASATLIEEGGAAQPSQTLAASAASGTAALSVVNQTQLPLPLTGSNSALLCVGAGVTVALGAAVFGRREKKPAASRQDQ